MSGRTGIEWTDRTWNPVVGCTKVSQGCKLCYAKTLHDMRYQAFLDGKNVAPQYHVPFEQIQLKPERLTWPLSLREPSRIFVNSVSDLFHEDVPFDYIDDVFAMMLVASRHTFQILTKRPGRMQEYLSTGGSRHGIALALKGHGLRGRVELPLPNVWLGVSVENQAAADERIPWLLQTPAAIRFLSCEPLLGPIDLLHLPRPGAHHDWLTGERQGALGKSTTAHIDWVICGGESGSSNQSPRPMHPDWARSLRNQCSNARVSFLFKQWGDYSTETVLGTEPVLAELKPTQLVAYGDGETNHVRYTRVGKKRAGRELDGRTWDEFPAVAS